MTQPPVQVRACASCRIRPAVVINDNPRFCEACYAKIPERSRQQPAATSDQRECPTGKRQSICSQLLITKDQKTSLHWESNPGPQTWASLCLYEEVLIGGRRGGGKLQPLDSPVCTPKGFVRMGDLAVGDAVTDPTSGGTQRVIAIHPHGEMDIWRVTFDDGATTEVGMEHLWSYRRSNTQRPHTKRSYRSEHFRCKSLARSLDPTKNGDRYRIGTAPARCKTGTGSRRNDLASPSPNQ